MKNYRAVWGSAILIALWFVALFILIFVDQEQAHSKNCDTIRETAEYVVDDLIEADCINFI